MFFLEAVEAKFEVQFHLVTLLLMQCLLMLLLRGAVRERVIG